MASLFLCLDLFQQSAKQEKPLITNKAQACTCLSYLLWKLADAIGKGGLHRFQLCTAFVKSAIDWARINELKYTLTALVTL